MGVVIEGGPEIVPSLDTGTYFHAHATMKDRNKSLTTGQKNHGGHILIIDDEKPILELAQRVLSTQGYKTTTCGSGNEGIEVYAELNDKIDLVILDMIMPEMNGVETLHKLKLIDPTVRAVLCSAFIPDLEESTVAAEGFVGFIAKPFQIDDLLAIAELHLP